MEKINNMFKKEEDTEEEKLSALHAALYDGNNRAIDILLSYMAKIPLNCSENFCDILYQTVD